MLKYFHSCKFKIDTLSRWKYQESILAFDHKSLKRFHFRCSTQLPPSYLCQIWHTTQFTRFEESDMFSSGILSSLKILFRDLISTSQWYRHVSSPITRLFTYQDCPLQTFLASPDTFSPVESSGFHCGYVILKLKKFCHV